MVVCFLAVRFLSCVFYVLFCLFYLATSKEGNEDRFSFVSYVLNVEGLVLATVQGVQY